MRGSSSRWTVGVMVAGLAAWGASPAAPAARVTLQARQQSLPQVVSQLSQALAAPVRVEGERKAPVSVELLDGSYREALDAVAAAADGRWQRLYVLSGKGKGGSAGHFVSGRLVTLSLDGATVANAAGMVARAAGARLELEEVPNKPVSITAESEPVEAVFDRLAKESGLQWRAEYVLMVAEPVVKPAVPKPATPAPTAARSATAPRSGARGGRGGSQTLPGSNAPAQPTKRGSPTGYQAARTAADLPADRALNKPDFYQYVFRLPRAKREPFIQSLAEELQGGVDTSIPQSSLMAQMQFERRMRRNAILKQIQGLTPAQQKELKPVTDAILQGMRTGTETGGAGAQPQP